MGLPWPDHIKTQWACGPLIDPRWTRRSPLTEARHKQGPRCQARAHQQECRSSPRDLVSVPWTSKHPGSASLLALSIQTSTNGEAAFGLPKARAGHWGDSGFRKECVCVRACIRVCAYVHVCTHAENVCVSPCAMNLWVCVCTRVGVCTRMFK